MSEPEEMTRATMGARGELLMTEMDQAGALRYEDGTTVPLLFSHDTASPIGRLDASGKLVMSTSGKLFMDRMDQTRERQARSYRDLQYALRYALRDALRDVDGRVVPQGKGPVIDIEPVATATIAEPAAEPADKPADNGLQRMLIIRDEYRKWISNKTPWIRKAKRRLKKGDRKAAK